MKSEPRVSVGLPVFNGEEFLPESLASLLAQTFEDFEVVVSDNGSTDRTEEICRAVASSDRRVRYYKSGLNRGAAWNYNRVFALSRGKYFRWHADDDICHAEFLMSCVGALEDRVDAVLAYTGIGVIDRGGNPIPMLSRDLQLNSGDVATRFRRALEKLQYSDSPIFGLVRRDVLAKTRLIGPYVSSDRCLVVELTLHGPFVRVPDVLFFRRKHDRNVGGSAEFLGWYDPRLAGRVSFPEWRILLENAASIRRSPLDVHEQLRLFLVLARRVGQRRKALMWQLNDGLGKALRLC